MRIVIVLEYFYNLDKPIGGAERQINKLAGKFIEAGVEVRLVTGQWKWGEPRNEIINTIPVYRLFTFWGMFDIRGLRKFAHYVYLISLFLYLFFNKSKYDFIHCHSAMASAFVVALAGNLFDKKTLARPMASGSTWGDISRMKAQQSLMGSQLMLNKLKDNDVIIALNQDVVTELEELGIESGKIVSMPNGVETDGITYKTDYKAGPVTKITFVGRLHAQKGLETLLIAFSQVLKQIPSQKLCLQLVGTGPLQSTLEATIQKFDIVDQVVFLGQLPDVFPVLYDSDIFVLPSRAEGMSNALLEAMTCGLPCIVSDIPANTILIKNRQTGLLAKVDDAEDLAQAILQLVEDQTLREKLGQAARQTILENYSITSVAQKFISLYKNVLQKSSTYRIRNTV